MEGKKRFKGVFVAVDGLDGVGKGEVERGLRGVEERKGKAVFDSISFSKANERLPEFREVFSHPYPHYNVIMTAEPTYEGIGKVIRDEIIAINGRDYPSSVQVQMYSANRLVQMKKVDIPVLEEGLTNLKSRCFASTLVYQVHKAEMEGLSDRGIRSLKNQILSHEGNRLQMAYRPDLLIIPTIQSIDVLFKRLEERGKTRKDDNSEFENADFQAGIKPFYESPELRDLFEKLGTRVAYLDASVSEEFTRRQGIEIYTTFLKTGNVLDKFRTPKF